MVGLQIHTYKFPFCNNFILEKGKINKAETVLEYFQKLHHWDCFSSVVEEVEKEKSIMDYSDHALESFMSFLSAYIFIKTQKAFCSISSNAPDVFVTAA